MVRAIGLGAATLALLVAAAAPNAAAAAPPIKPNQHFLGLVNGKHDHAVLYVLCAGPMGGQGHVAAGQTVAAERVGRGGGDTGSGGGQISVRITPTTIVALKRYRRTQSIPTSAEVPCQGTGTVTFSTCALPQPCGAGAAPDNVSVTYLNPGAQRSRSPS